ncbi:MAG: sulfurtransferase TusA family protein [Candidatus Omnitrophica bacterium]|nr:sulfurtransferase TusA family protein [Candidatus Omnitrophota bacterium]
MFKLPEKIKKDLENYSKAIEDYLEGKSSWQRFSGVRVPWGNYSHRGGKIFMGRIRIPAGVLLPYQLKALAEASQRYGDGMLHITTRQDIQIHDVKAEDIIKVHNFLKDYQLSSRGGGGNTVRNITACPLSGVCPDEVFDVREDAVALTEYLISDEVSYNLPRKFKISFSGCSLDCGGCLVNDVGLVALRRDYQDGYRVFVGGGMGAVSLTGRILEDFILRKDLGYVISAIRNTFYKYGDRKNKHHNRLRFLIQDVGFDKFKEYYSRELKELKEDEYICLRKINFNYPFPKAVSFSGAEDKGFREFLKYNCQNQRQDGFSIVKLRIPRGDLPAKTAEELVGLVSAFTQIEFRTSPEQNLYIVNFPQDKLHNLYTKLTTLSLDFLYPQTLIDIVACKGSTTCNLGLCNSPGLAKELERVIKENFLASTVFDKLKIKINGCPNACGHHPLGMVSFCGAVRKLKERPVPFYRLFLGGMAKADKTKLASDTGILLPAKNVPLFLKDFLKEIKREIGDDTDIYKFIEDRAKDIANEVAQKYTYVPDYTENKSFYVDWGRNEEFSLNGLGPGECGAGVLDMIEADLSEAGIFLQQAEKEEYSIIHIKKSILLAARALLVVRGIDPKTEEEVFSGFTERFVKEELVDAKYSRLKEEFSSLQEELNFSERERWFRFAQGFIQDIRNLYQDMDPAFNFPKLKRKEEIVNHSERYLLDLKGTPCPINYVKTKLFLEDLKSGETLEVLLDEGEPINNVPKSLEADGHKILKIEKKDGFYSVVVEKA